MNFKLYLKKTSLLAKGLFQKAVRCGLTNWMPDAMYLKLRYKHLMEKKLDLNHPKTFNEKIQWLKLYDRKDIYPTIVDKYAVREYIAKELGEEYLIPILGVWESVEEIDFDSLPNQFVLKCTHGSKCNVVCTDKKTLNVEEAKKNLAKWMEINYFYHSREWPYKSVKPRIIAEKYMLSSGEEELIDYKFYCNNGRPDYVMVCVGRAKDDLRFLFFDREWKFHRFNIGDEKYPEDFTYPMPSCIPKMFEIAEKLSAGFPFLRVDLYESGGKIYFGELTLYPSGGFDRDIYPETDAHLGSLINLKK